MLLLKLLLNSLSYYEQVITCINARHNLSWRCLLFGSTLVSLFIEACLNKMIVLVTHCSCSSSVCVCLALVRISWCSSTPAKWTLSRTSTCCWASSRTTRSQHEPTSIAAPTGDPVATWADVHECRYSWERTRRHVVFVSSFAASCAAVLQWRAAIELQCFSSRTGQMSFFSRPLHPSCWWGLPANDVDLWSGTSCDLCPLLSTVQSICNPRRGVLHGVCGAEGPVCLHPRPIHSGQVC